MSSFKRFLDDLDKSFYSNLPLLFFYEMKTKQKSADEFYKSEVIEIMEVSDISKDTTWQKFQFLTAAQLYVFQCLF